jgi:hypothetical protein
MTAAPRPQPARKSSSAADTGRQARPVYIAAVVVAALWAILVGAVATPLEAGGHAVTILLLLAFGPTALVFGLAYVVRQGHKLAAASRGPDDQGVAMFGPALRAAASAGQATHVMGYEMAATVAAADRAQDDLFALRQALAGEHEAIQAISAFLDDSRTLAGRIGAERRGLEKLSRTLDAQLKDAAELIDQALRRVVGRSREAGARFLEADRAVHEGAERLAPAAARAADVLRMAGEQAGRSAAELESAAVREGTDPAEALHQPGAQLHASARDLRAAREEHLTEAGAQGIRLHALSDRIRFTAADIVEGVLMVGDALRRLGQPPPAAALPTTPDLPQSLAPSAAAGAGTPTPKFQQDWAHRNAVVRAPEAESSDAVIVARGLGGRILFDGHRILIDRTQSASFVLHGSGGQRSIQLVEVTKIRLVPPRRGAHGYLQFLLSRGIAGRGGPADVNSILFNAGEQPQFEALANALRRAMRHLRRGPLVSDPRAPGEMAHLMDLRGRGLIDAQEFAEASARLPAAKRGLSFWKRRK